jgi:hypothetical protein
MTGCEGRGFAKTKEGWRRIQLNCLRLRLFVSFLLFSFEDGQVGSKEGCCLFGASAGEQNIRDVCSGKVEDFLGVLGKALPP